MVNALPDKPRKRKRKSALFTQRKKRAAPAPVVTPARSEINRIIAAPPDYGVRELAWKTLNMHSRPGAQAQCPTSGNFIRDVNAMIALVHPCQLDLTQYPEKERRNVLQRARQATKKILMAARTIGGFQNEYWNSSWDGDLIVINMGDVRPGATWDGTDPIPEDQLEYHIAPLGEAGIRRMRWVHPLLDPPTTNEVIQRTWNREKAYPNGPLMRGYDVEDAYIYNTNQTLRKYPTLGDGNCWLYALSETLNGLGNWLPLGDSWAGFAQIKANLRKHLMRALNDPTHPRHRAYCYMEMISRLRSETWGTTSLIRTLHACSRHASLTRYRPHNPYGINQVFADYYYVELFEFDDFTMIEGDDDDDEEEAYAWEVPTIRGSTNAPRQLYLFTLPFSPHTEAGHPPVGRGADYKMTIGSDLVPWRDRIDQFPWHPNDRSTMNQSHLPRRLPENLRWADPTTRATQLEVNYVLADRNFPDLMPRLQSQADMDNLWSQPAPGPDHGIDPGAVPFPGNAMPTYAVRDVHWPPRAAYGEYPHRSDGIPRPDKDPPIY